MTQNELHPASAGLHRHGKLSYIEIPAVDVAESAAFYQRVFGWNVRGNGDAFDDTTSEIIGHWVTGRRVSEEAGILPYIYVESIDRTVAEVRAQGCEVVRGPFEEGPLWVAIFRDPAGNLIGVWQARPR